MMKLGKIAVAILLLSTAAHAQTINNLSAGSAPTGTELVPVYQGANPAVHVTAQGIANLAVTSVAAGCGSSAAPSPITSSGTIAAAIVTNSVSAAGAYAMQTTDCGKNVVLGAAVTGISLVAATTTGFTSGYFTTIDNQSGGALTLTVTTSTIDGASTVSIPNGATLAINSDGTNYHNTNSLVAASLAGATFANPGAIGSGTAGTGAFTTITSTSEVASAGLVSTGSFGGSFTDGLALDYTSGTGRFSVGSSDGFAWYNGGIASSSLMTLSNAGALGITGTITAASLSTSGIIAGSLCQTAAGLVLYEAGVNCYAGIVGPGTTVLNDVACWNNLVGTLLKDCGAAVNAASANTWTNTNNFTGTFEVGSTTQTFPASGNIVGTSDIQTLTNKSISAAEVNSGTLPCGQMPALTGNVTSSAGGCGTTIAAAAVTDAMLATATQNTIVGAATSTAKTDLAVPSCSAAGNALQWVANTGLQCGTLTNPSAGFGLQGTSTFTINQTQPPYGYDVPINLGLTATVGSSALTINVTGANGSAPSASNPVLVPFRSTTLATGTPSWTAITGALSIVVNSGATLGTSSSNVPFRVWIFLAYNAGTPELGVATCSSATAIYPCAAWESTRVTTTTITGLANSLGTLYATTGVSSDSVRIIGYCDYASGLGTAGAWASACTTLQLTGPGSKKPGDVIQTIAPAFGTLIVATGTTLAATNVTATITPTSSANLIKYYASTSAGNNTTTHPVYLQMYRGTTAIGSTLLGGLVNSLGLSITFVGFDNPASTSAQTYVIKAVNDGTGTWSVPLVNTYSSTEILEEIMGSLDTPVNDNDLPRSMVG